MVDQNLKSSNIQENARGTKCYSNQNRLWEALIGRERKEEKEECEGENRFKN